MSKPARLWVVAASQPRVVVGWAVAATPVVPPLPVSRSSSIEGAELAGPWLLRAAVRVPRAGQKPADAGVEARRWMGALHVRWLRRMGVDDASLYEGPALPHWAGFASRGAGDVVLGRRKIVAVTEFRRAGEALLVASTLLRPPPWALLCRTLQRPREDAELLAATSVSASTVVGPPLDEQQWAASLRSTLHLSLTLPELREGSTEGG